MGVFALGQREGHARSVVGAGLHLVDVPFAAQIGGVHDPHVGTHAIDLLIVPEREGVVVAVVDDDGVGQRGLEVVPADVARHVAARPVVVVPVLGRQNRGHGHADGRCGDGRRRVAPGQPCEEFAQGQHAEADPDREGVERAGIDVVAFAGFARRGVEVEDQRDTRHDE